MVQNQYDDWSAMSGTDRDWAMCADGAALLRPSARSIVVHRSPDTGSRWISYFADENDIDRLRTGLAPTEGDFAPLCTEHGWFLDDWRELYESQETFRPEVERLRLRRFDDTIVVLRGSDGFVAYCCSGG